MLADTSVFSLIPVDRDPSWIELNWIEIRSVITQLLKLKKQMMKTTEYFGQKEPLDDKARAEVSKIRNALEFDE